MGTADITVPAVTQTPVHPHVRGDGPLPVYAVDPVSGSPPRAWGRLWRGQASTYSYRFTPTCVGTAGISSAIVLLLAVHPHVRGDGLQFLPFPQQGSGSPPRAWGRRHTPAYRQLELRFTPTCVGTAHSGHMRSALISVHPHVRGDGVNTTKSRLMLLGSPPRAWGRRDSVLSCFGSGRFTPTCVGTAWSPVPHASSYRFTPTCVGTAQARCSTSCLASVHPHVRGDGDGFLIRHPKPVGSPPRAWGRRLPEFTERATGRFTPTCVGTAGIRR